MIALILWINQTQNNQFLEKKVMLYFLTLVTLNYVKYIFINKNIYGEDMTNAKFATAE